MVSVAIVGPGAIGCAVGAALVERTDHDVVFCARTPFEQLVVSVEYAPPTTMMVRCETDPTKVEVADVALLCTKANQTEAARPWLDATVGPDTLVAVLQNGVEHLERVTPLVASDRVLPVVVALPALRSAPGVIGRGKNADLVAPAGVDGEQLRGLFKGTDITVHVVDDWLNRAWMKLIVNAANGAVTTLTRRSNLVFADEEAENLCLALMEEVASVGRAEGAALPENIARFIFDRARERAANHTNSITADRIAGRPTEWEARNQVVVRLAAKHGIEVPLNRALTTLIRLGEPTD